jgi:uncharacterized damage-inducible protein DinB
MADMWTDPESDPRSSDAPDGELANYREYLDNYRLTLGMKCEGLSPEELARQSVPPSNLSLLGLVRHMARVEHSWFQRALQGNLDEPRPYSDPDDPDVEFTGVVGTQECVDDAFEQWRHQIARADEWLASQTDESMATRLAYNSDGDVASIRDILIHLIEEYARHCGHADLLRECIDGRTGQ